MIFSRALSCLFRSFVKPFVGDVRGPTVGMCVCVCRGGVAAAESRGRRRRSRIARPSFRASVSRELIGVGHCQRASESIKSATASAADKSSSTGPADDINDASVGETETVIDDVGATRRREKDGESETRGGNVGKTVMRGKRGETGREREREREKEREDFGLKFAAFEFFYLDRASVFASRRPDDERRASRRPYLRHL